MIKKMMLLLTLFLVSAASFGALSEHTIYFINGLDNEPQEAEAARRALRALVLPEMTDTNIKLLYQRNTGTIKEMLARVKLQANADNQRQIYKLFWKCVTLPSPDNCKPDDLQQINPDMQKLIFDTLANYDETAFVQSPRLQAMVGELVYNHNTRGKKSLLVAHSQGTFYANQAVNFLQSFYPEVAACTNIVGVATPATYIAKNGLYETRNDDLIINSARTFWPWGASILSPTTGSTGGDASGHKFIDSYIAPTTPRDRIRQDINLQTASDPYSNCSIDCAPFTQTATFDPNGSVVFVKRHLGKGKRTIHVRLNMEFGYSYLNGYDAVGIQIRDSSNPPVYILNEALSNYYNNSGTYYYSFEFDSSINGEDVFVWTYTYWNGSPDTIVTSCVDCGYTTGPAACP